MSFITMNNKDSGSYTVSVSYSFTDGMQFNSFWNVYNADDLLSGIDLSLLTPDEIEMLKQLNEELNPKLPVGSRPISQQQQSNCTCSLQDLMSSGCKCGAFKREKEK